MGYSCAMLYSCIGMDLGGQGCVLTFYTFNRPHHLYPPFTININGSHQMDCISLASKPGNEPFSLIHLQYFC